MSSLNEYLLKHGVQVIEGNSQQVQAQIDDLTMVCKLLCKDTKTIIEIGFNAGHSSEIFLKNTNANVISFDIGYWKDAYLNKGKEYLDITYPQRHSLIIGDSTQSIPLFNYPIKADLIFIDGGHEYETAKADLINCKKFAHKDTILAFDDVYFIESGINPHNIGCNKAWVEVCNENLVKDTVVRHYTTIGGGRGMAFAKYNL